MDELLEQFLVEGRELVAAAHEALAVLTGDPANADAVDRAFRAFHTLKGSVTLFDLKPAEHILHAGEDLLDRARKGAAGLSSGDIARLIAILDQIDRWIDALEREGEIEAGAAGIAERLLIGAPRAQAITPADDEQQASTPAEPWLAALLERRAAVVAQGEDALVAFRYAPDRDAFFRGEDPLALVGGVPGLIALDILPPDGHWPAADAIEPFECGMVIEGVSAATPDALRQSFRLVPDQVRFHSLAARAQPAKGDDSGLPLAASVLRVDARRVDALADDVGELIVAANAFAPLGDRAEALDAGFALDIRAAQAGLERAVGRLSRSVSAVRLISLAPTLARLPRMVREIADGLGKPVDFAVSGEQVEVDKQIADGLFEPLLHLVRNAIDHGIEDAATRARSGKPANGQLALAVARDGDDILMSLSDDGAGIDRARVRDVAVARGLIEREAADALSDAGTLALIFAPGFSTAAAVTGVSGRGVGMDAVQAAVERLRGGVEIESVPGHGTRFQLRLPANAITTRLLVVEVARDRYGVPFDQISETVRVGADRLIPLGTGTACVLRDRTVPVLSLAGLLGMADDGGFPAKLLVTRAGGEPVALRVDGFHERLDAMVRPPSGLLAGLPMVRGTTVTGDGAVLLVLNISELVA